MGERPSDVDKRLLASWRSGDQRAGNELVRRHLPGLSRYFCRRVSESQAEDLLQRTFLACVEAKDRLPPAGVRAYLFGIARNQLLMFLRASRREVRGDLEEDALARTSLGPAAQAAEREEQRLLFRALAALPLDLQLVVELFYWEDLTHPEIAAVLGIPEGTVKTRLFRARARIEALMAQAGKTADLSALTLRELDQWASSRRAMARKTDG